MKRLVRIAAAAGAVGLGILIVPGGDAGANHRDIRPGKSCQTIDDRDGRRACIHGLRDAKKAVRRAAH